MSNEEKLSAFEAREALAIDPLMKTLSIGMFPRHMMERTGLMRYASKEGKTRIVVEYDNDTGDGMRVAFRIPPVQRRPYKSDRIDRILSEEEGHLSMVNFIHTDVFQKGLLALADVVSALRGAMFAKERFHTEIDYDAEAQSVTVVTRVREDDNDGMCPEAVRGLWTRPQEDTARHE